MNKKGFVIVIAAGFAVTLLLVALAIVSLSCGEIIQTRVFNDKEAAYYVAMAGAERMYAYMKSKEGQIVTWPQSIPPSDGVVRTRANGGSTVGTFSATANTAGTDVFAVVSNGTVNGRTSTITVKYGYTMPFMNGYPLGCRGPMSLSGSHIQILFWTFQSLVRAEGPLACGSAITTNNFVQISGSTLENQSFSPISFWYGYNPATGACDIPKAVGDTNGNSAYLTDTNGDGRVTVADAGDDIDKQAIFTADDINSDGVIDDKDAFTAYYTVELNKKGLNIGKNQAYYYNGDQTFLPNSIPASTPIVFVSGNVNILFNSTQWWAQNANNTIVATGDINIVQPTNTQNSTLTLISYGDVNTGGINFLSGVQGNMVTFSNSDFNAYYGGKINGAMYANGSIDVDTVLPVPGLLNRDINKGTIDWTDPSNWPLGIPNNYNTITSPFIIKNEKTVYVPVWQRE